MGSPSLILVLIAVVWAIVLAPLLLGNTKPIRRSGEGYEETRVLHTGGTIPAVTRRRPRFTAADAKRYTPAAPADAELSLVDAASHPASTQTDTPARAGSTRVNLALSKADTEVMPVVTFAEVPRGGSTAYSVLLARAAADDAGYYELNESYLSPRDFGYAPLPVAVANEDGDAGQESETETATSGNAADAEDTSGQTDAVTADAQPDADAQSEADDTPDDEVSPSDEAARGAGADPGEADTPSEEDLAFAAARAGRGGFDPGRAQQARAGRIQRRKWTFIGLLAVTAVCLLAAVIVGGWVWVLPTVAIAVTAWFMVALRRVVKQEHALHQRRLRQLRRARLGVDTARRPGPAVRERRRAGSIILDLDDENPDFDHLPRCRVTAEDGHLAGDLQRA